jgi:hypothetical protein
VGEKRFEVVLSPICPRLFCPQHNAAPAVVTAQLCVLPTAIAATPELKPVGEVGTFRFVAVPSPI